MVYLVPHSFIHSGLDTVYNTNYMKKLIFVIIVTVGLVSCGNLKLASWKTDTFCRETGDKSTVLLEVHPVSSKYNSLSEEAKRSAVFEVMFHGVGKNGLFVCDSIPPIIADPSILISNEKFFKKFFQLYGGYSKYVNLVETTGQFELVKVRGSGWRMGHVTTVFRDMLKEDLKTQGILK
jgi:hypothetical protein